MRILFINEKTAYFENIVKGFIRMGDDIALFDPPERSANMTQAPYLISFNETVKSFKPDLIISTTFFSIISLAAAVNGIQYRVWILGGYNPNNYEYELNNDRDTIYVSDSFSYKLYTEIGLRNIYMLPYAYIDRDYVKEKWSTATEDKKSDISIMTECAGKQSGVNDIMPLLKDASKGYIDAYIEAMKNDLHKGFIYKELPEYVRKDIEEKYPLKETTYESAGLMYDNRFFIPHMDESLAVGYVLACIDIDIIDSITLYTSCQFPYYNEKLNIINKSDSDMDVYKLRGTKIVIYMPGHNDGAILIPNIISLIDDDIAVILPAHVDDGITNMYEIPVFSNTTELEKLLRRYIGSDKERTELKKRQKNALNKNRKDSILAFREEVSGA